MIYYIVSSDGASNVKVNANGFSYVENILEFKDEKEETIALVNVNNISIIYTIEEKL
jgi:hypothetical protein